MPFAKRARLTFTNEGQKAVPLYYQIDYTLGDKHPDDVGRLHVALPPRKPHDREDRTSSCCPSASRRAGSSAR